MKNIKSIFIGATGTTIQNAQDHAKWAVTVSSKKPTEDIGNWICLGDINRQVINRLFIVIFYDYVVNTFNTSWSKAVTI